MTIRLGILDAVPPEFYLDGEKSDPQKFVDLFAAISAPMSFSTYNATQGHFPGVLDECDAYLITGSPCSVYDSYPWIQDLEKFIRHVDTSRTPLIGICFGHQLIAQALGGEVRAAEAGWLLGLHPFEIQNRKSWMDVQSANPALYFINEDQVVRLPPDAELLAGSDSCPNAMYTVDGKLLSIQGHPEQPLSSMRVFTRVLLEKNKVDPAVVDAAHESMGAGEPDAQQVARWICNFLGAPV